MVEQALAGFVDDSHQARVVVCAPAAESSTPASVLLENVVVLAFSVLDGGRERVTLAVVVVARVVKRSWLLQWKGGDSDNEEGGDKGKSDHGPWQIQSKGKQGD